MKQMLVLLALTFSLPAWAENYTGKVHCQAQDGTVAESVLAPIDLFENTEGKPLFRVTTPPYGPNSYYVLSGSIDTKANQLRLAGPGAKDFDGEWFVLTIDLGRGTGRLERQLFRPMDLGSCSWENP